MITFILYYYGCAAGTSMYPLIHIFQITRLY